MTHHKKLIEVALPLEDINAASAREKSIRHGHPSTLHLWWARRPLAAARAVIFAQMVDDPSGYVDELWEDAELLRKLGRQIGRKVSPRDRSEAHDDILIKIERERLFDLIRELVLWENTTNERVLEPAREEIRKSWRRTCRREGQPEDTPLPAFHDPFAGGGAIPLEAQRLGFESHASDLNPVAVLINKAMIEIPPKFANRPPVHPVAREEEGTQGWRGASGLAEDVRRYGGWMREEAFKRIGHLYPPVEVTRDMVQQRPDLKQYEGQKLTVIAWIWARTVKSPNPAVSHVDVPLASTFLLSSKAGKEAYVQPVIEGDAYRFEVKVGKPPAEAKEGTKAVGRGANFECLLTRTPIHGDYIKTEGQAGRMGDRLMAIVAEGNRGRVYLSPTDNIEKLARTAEPTWRPVGDVPARLTGGTCVPYGLREWGDLFTPRQLVALTTFSDLVGEVREHIERDALASGMTDDGNGLESGGIGAKAYAEAVSVYLAFALGKLANLGSSLTSWMNDRGAFRETFARQAIPMIWDFAEANSFANAGGSVDTVIDKVAKAISFLSASTQASARQQDAQTQSISSNKVISTDPPYYDNIGYADLSDFFYVWQRKALGGILPTLFSTISVPKAEELVATPYRHGNKQKAEAFFLEGMTFAIERFASLAHPVAPLTIYYAFKQSETTEEEGTISPGWVSFLGAVHKAGLEVVGTWPVRTESSGRMIGQGTNALASSIVLVCRKRLPQASMATRREFVQALQRELPKALIDLQHGNIAPVDLPQSSIGPGMAIFSRYAKVVESDGKPMSVRTALQLINQAVDEFLSEQEAQMDDWTRFAITWFSQYGFKQGAYGDAQNIATARNVTVEGVRDAGILETGGGKVRLLTVEELKPDWNPQADARCTIWEVVHHLIKRLNDGGEDAAARLLKEVGGLGEDARALCYRLYTLCEQKKWADEARAYNTLIGIWPGLTKLSDNFASVRTQGELKL